MPLPKNALEEYTDDDLLYEQIRANLSLIKQIMKISDLNNRR